LLCSFPGLQEGKGGRKIKRLKCSLKKKIKREKLARGIKRPGVTGALPAGLAAPDQTEGKDD
jgi:hypothetical protein